MSNSLYIFTLAHKSYNWFWKVHYNCTINTSIQQIHFITWKCFLYLKSKSMNNLIIFNSCYFSAGIKILHHLTVSPPLSNIFDCPLSHTVWLLNQQHCCQVVMVSDCWVSCHSRTPPWACSRSHGRHDVYLGNHERLKKMKEPGKVVLCHLMSET